MATITGHIYIVNPSTHEVLHKLKSGGYAWLPELFICYGLDKNGYPTETSVPVVYKSHTWAMKKAQKMNPDWTRWEVHTLGSLMESGTYDKQTGRMVGK